MKIGSPLYWLVYENSSNDNAIYSKLKGLDDLKTKTSEF